MVLTWPICSGRGRAVQQAEQCGGSPEVSCRLRQLPVLRLACSLGNGTGAKCEDETGKRGEQLRQSFALYIKNTVFAGNYGKVLSGSCHIEISFEKITHSRVEDGLDGDVCQG